MTGFDWALIGAGVALVMLFGLAWLADRVHRCKHCSHWTRYPGTYIGACNVDTSLGSHIREPNDDGCPDFERRK